jgi:hypothetical protein
MSPTSLLLIQESSKEVNETMSFSELQILDVEHVASILPSHGQGDRCQPD